MQSQPNGGQDSVRPSPPAGSVGSGRADLQIVFNWLKDEKKVKKVFRVIVDDLQEPSHQDEAIEACLRDIEGVGTWDWKKIDLSPDIIQNAARHAKIVHLYWSGRNIALRAWSEDRGLRQLEHLQEIHLHYQQGLESQVRMKQYISEFKHTMESYTRKDTAGKETRITVIPCQLKSNDRSGPSNRASMFKDRYEPEKWIKTMERFAEFLQTAERAERTDPKYTAREPIKVAVIDDGVNTFDPRIHVGGGRSFCRRNKSQNLVHSYYVSSQGHGTAMALCISQICPNVQLYILRLDEYSSEPGKSFFTAESAEKAVRAAIEQKVDIISMSWTIEETDDNKQHVAALDKAISEAARQNILMFCAATDGGAQTDFSYPAMASTKHIFKIGGAEPSGNPHKWLGETNVDFILPGTYQEQHGGGSGGIEQSNNNSVMAYRPRTGSSVATARASGLAAVILHCARGSAVRAGTGTAYKDLRNHDRMNEVFSQIGTTAGKYIQVWEKFDRPVKEAEGTNTPRDEWTIHVDDLVRRLTWRG
ncbi:efflux pump aflT [Apiospora arundinis]